MTGAGRLTERVVIQQRADVSDGQGGATTTWSTLATVWAAVLPRPAVAESLQAGAVTATGGYDIEIRYRMDVTAKMRLLWTPYLAAAAKTLEIADTPRPKDGRREFLVFACDEVAA